MTATSHRTSTSSASALAIWANLIAVYVIWGSTYLAIRFAVATIPPFLMASVRHLIVGVLLLGWTRLRGHAAPTRKEWQAAAIVGVFLLVGGNGVVSWAEQRVASGLAALLLGAIPLWIVVLDAVRPAGHRPGLRPACAVLVGFVGIVVLIGPTRITGSATTTDPFGALAVLAAALSWSIGSLYGRSAPHPDSPLLGTGMQSLTAGAVLFVVAALSGNFARLDLGAISLQSLGGLAYLIVFGSCIGFAAYGWLIRKAPTTLVSTYAYVNPLVAIVLGHLLAAEPLSVNVVIAATLILGSVALITTTRASEADLPPAAETG
jgi:drug/metabolite transporter (DMT)-like permease